MNWFFKNFWLKIIAFVMGLLVWFHVATEKTYNYELRLPVTEIMLGDELSLSEAPPDSLLVSVSATGKQLLRRNWRKEGLRVNATQYRAGRHNMALARANTSLVYTDDIMSLDEIIAPASIALEIDEKVTKSVRVEPDLDVTADDGFAVGQELMVVPEEVALIGPRSRLGRITEVSTERRRLSGVRNPVTIEVALVAPEGFGFELQPDSVRVTIPVVPVKTRVYEDIPVVVFNAPPLVKVATDPVSLRVEITGPPEDIDLLNRNALTLSVDYRQMDASLKAAVKVDLPPGFSLKRLNRDSVIILMGADADAGN